MPRSLKCVGVQYDACCMPFALSVNNAWPAIKTTCIDFANDIVERAFGCLTTKLNDFIGSLKLK